MFYDLKTRLDNIYNLMYSASIYSTLKVVNDIQYFDFRNSHPLCTPERILQCCFVGEKPLKMSIQLMRKYKFFFLLCPSQKTSRETRHERKKSTSERRLIKRRRNRFSSKIVTVKTQFVKSCRRFGRRIG